MILNPHPIYPAAGRYVLRLHRDARPQAGVLAGRIEHVSTGDGADFTNASELLAWLAGHASSAQQGTAASRDSAAPKEIP